MEEQTTNPKKETWADHTSLLPKPKVDPNDPNSADVPIENPQVLSIECRLFIAGGKDCDKCYVLGDLKNSKEVPPPPEEEKKGDAPPPDPNAPPPPAEDPNAPPGAQPAPAAAEPGAAELQAAEEQKGEEKEPPKPLK